MLDFVFVSLVRYLKRLLPVHREMSFLWGDKILTVKRGRARNTRVLPHTVRVALVYSRSARTRGNFREAGRSAMRTSWEMNKK